MTKKIKCDDCAWFQRDDIHPATGLGRCMHEARHGYWHALADHYCRDYEAMEHDDAATEA